MKKTGKKWWYLLKNTWIEFANDNAIKLSASLSFYTIFSLPALLIIIIYVFGLFFGHDAVIGDLFNQINSLVGNNTAFEIQEVIKNVVLSGNNVFITGVGITVLLVGAIGVFSEIQSSINYIWGIRAKPKQGLVIFFRNRVASFSIIGSVSFLLMVGLIINTIMDVLNRHLISHFPGVTVYLFYLLDMLFVFLTTTALFAIIFKTLPDGKISVKDSVMGALFSSTLFMLGKFVIGAYLSNSHITTMYGAAGSLTLLLIWVYYSSIVLYLGVEFTKVHAHLQGNKIIPNEYSIMV